MPNNYLVINSNEYETLDTVIFKVISNTTFKRAWALLAETLGFQMAPNSQVPDLHVTKSGKDYIIHHLAEPSPSNAKITVSKINFQFVSDTIVLGDAKSTQLTPDTSMSMNLINNDNFPKKFTRKCSTVSSSSTTISSSHTIAAGLSIKQSFSTGAPGFFSASLDLSFSFSYNYTFGNQQKKQESTESIDTVSITIPPNTKIPLTLTSFKTSLTVPFTALAQMFYIITIEGAFNRSGAPHKTLGTLTSHIPEIIKYSYTFGNESKSAEDTFTEEDTNNFIPGITPWNWTYINLTSQRLDLNFKKAIQNGFATQINGKFEKNDSKVLNVQTGIPNINTK